MHENETFGKAVSCRSENEQTVLVFYNQKKHKECMEKNDK